MFACPLTSLVGEEGRGWDYAKFLLGQRTDHDGARCRATSAC